MFSFEAISTFDMAGEVLSISHADCIFCFATRCENVRPVFSWIRAERYPAESPLASATEVRVAFPVSLLIVSSILVSRSFFAVGVMGK